MELSFNCYKNQGHYRRCSKEVDLNIVRYFYRREPIGNNLNRVVTVSYIHNRETGETAYGASMFRQDQPGDNFIKAHHRHTADQRRLKCPVSINVANGTWNDIEDSIREAIRVHGVKGDRQVV
jgi:hypothetical protein